MASNKPQALYMALGVILEATDEQTQIEFFRWALSEAVKVADAAAGTPDAKPDVVQGDGLDDLRDRVKASGQPMSGLAALSGASAATIGKLVKGGTIQAGAAGKITAALDLLDEEAANQGSLPIQP